MIFSGSGWVYHPFEGARLVRKAGLATAHEIEYDVKTLFSDCPFHTSHGEVLRQISVAYETYGKLSPERDNVVLVCHALTGDSHVASHRRRSSNEGWWEAMVGEGRPIDTSRYFVVCSNVLGGCNGTTGPLTRHPVDNLAYGNRFPTVTVRDMVRVQRELLSALGIDHVHTVIGGSMGGMQALEWAVSYPDQVRNAIIVAAPGRIRAQSVAYNEVQRHAIQSDPDWNGGNYYPGEGPAKGLAVARMLGMITYQSEESMERKFGSARVRGKTTFTGHDWPKVRQYLRYQGEKLVKRFDANSYLCLLKALDLFDIGSENRDYYQALAAIKASVLVLGISSDILYPSHQQRELATDICCAGGRARYVEIQSTLGHDAFLLEFAQFGRVTREFMSRSE